MDYGNLQFSTERRNSLHLPDAGFSKCEILMKFKFYEFAEFFTCCLIQRDMIVSWYSWTATSINNLGMGHFG